MELVEERYQGAQHLYKSCTPCLQINSKATHRYDHKSQIILQIRMIFKFINECKSSNDTTKDIFSLWKVIFWTMSNVDKESIAPSPGVLLPAEKQ